MQDLRDVLRFKEGAPLIYTGVGSRKTPLVICEFMTQVAMRLHARGYTLRSGHAKRADQAFEAGAGTQKEIFLPEDGFEGGRHDGETTFLMPWSVDAINIAQKIVGHWHHLDTFGKVAHTRNVYQVLGRDLMTPSRFLLCWTNGPHNLGGTGTAINLARANDVPVYNLTDRDVFEHVRNVFGIPQRSDVILQFPF